MNDLPAVIPTWINLAEHGLVNLQREVLDPRFNPDFGGVGVDVRSSGQTLVRELKCNDVHANKFRARTVALPLIPPNPVNHCDETCLESQLQRNQQIEAFEASLLVYRGKLTAETKFSKAVNELVKAASERKKFSSTIPKQLVKLIRCKPKSLRYLEYNEQYVGGCLSTVPTSDDRGLLLRVSGADLDTLAVSSVEGSGEGPLVEVNKTVTYRSGKIYHLAVHRVNEVVYCTTRLEKQCLYLRTSDALESVEPIAEVKTYDTLCFATPSPYIPGEFLYITMAGELALYSCSKQRAVWKANVTHAADASWWLCCFGSHPRCICYMDGSGLYQQDAREPNMTRKALCSIEEDCFLNDKFTTLKTNDALPHQYYIGSSTHLTLWDERYWKQPMIQWNHGLKHSPTFMSQTKLGDCSYVALGSQRSREVALFCVDGSSSPQPSSTYPPWHMSRTCDFAKILERQNIDVLPSAQKRATAALIGACLVTCPRGLVGLQLTSFGDLFHQDFEHSFNGDLVNGSWKFGFGSSEYLDVLHDVQWWLDGATLPEGEESKEHLRWVNVKDVKEAFVAADVSADDFGVPQLDALQKAADEARCISYKEWRGGHEEFDGDLLDAAQNVDMDGAWDSRTTRLVEKWKAEPPSQDGMLAPFDDQEDNDVLTALRHTLEDLDVTSLPTPVTPSQQGLSQGDAQKKKKRRTQEGF